MRIHNWETRQSMTPQKALQFLKEGNQRFRSNLSVNRNLLQLVNETAEKQFPFAAILSCSDSRIPVELVFDQGLGDIFSVRLAGNIASVYAIASLEYSCKYLGSKLIVVMGHTGCGAVKGACDDLEDGNIHNILDLIKPAIQAETQTAENRNSSNKKFTDTVAELNVQQQINSILQNSIMLNEMISKNEVMIAGAMYNIENGKVTFLDEHNQKPHQHEKHEVYQR
jgi:carbonic anhydrase